MDKAAAGKFCIVGAGSSGLVTVKTFLEAGIPFDCFEREADIGGLWNEATPTGVVYETTHLVSARRFTAFDDFPMPVDYPFYPSHRQIMAYFKAYAAYFGLLPHITFNRTVERVTRTEAGWEVRIAGEAEPRLYRGVVIANGHHDVPRLPQVPGTFSGMTMHSRDYRSAKQLRDKRVVVVGAGNSGCDIVAEAAHSAAHTTLSMRRGQWFLPKFTFGWPTHSGTAVVEALPLPRLVKRFLFETSHYFLVGPAERFGLPKPAFHLDQAHPTMNDEIPRLAAHGRIAVKPAIARFEGDRVVYADGSSEAADVVVFATGYEVSMPFMDKAELFRADGELAMFLNVFHPRCDTLFATGLIQANGSIWRLAEYQAQLIASFLLATEREPDKAAWFRELKASGRTAGERSRFVGTDRHRLEANYFDYAKELRRLNRRFGPASLARRQLAPPVPAEPFPLPRPLAAIRDLWQRLHRRAGERSESPAHPGPAE